MFGGLEIPVPTAFVRDGVNANTWSDLFHEKILQHLMISHLLDIYVNLGHEGIDREYYRALKTMGGWRSLRDLNPQPSDSKSDTLSS